jgi:chromatin remodeling complex protein RSC6
MIKLLGCETTMPRTEVVKLLVAYVKANNLQVCRGSFLDSSSFISVYPSVHLTLLLQDAKDKRKIRFSDEKLYSIFKVKTTTFFGEWGVYLDLCLFPGLLCLFKSSS